MSRQPIESSVPQMSPVDSSGNGMNTDVVSGRARNYALGVLVVVYALNFVDRQILAILLPAIKVEFAVNDWVLGFLAGPAFALFYATLGVPIAVLADRFNRRNLIAIAIAIWSVMTALSGVASNIMLQIAMGSLQSVSLREGTYRGWSDSRRPSAGSVGPGSVSR